MADKLQTKSAQDAQRLMASVCEIKPEWHDAAQDIATAYRHERQDAQVQGKQGTLADQSAVASILAAIDTGLTIQQAATAIGFNATTAQRLSERGIKDLEAGLQSAHALFATACQMARERRRNRLLQRIEAAGEAGPQFWTAPAWLLERGYGQDYKLQQDSGRGNVIVQVGILAQGDVKVGLSEGESAGHNAIDGVMIPTTP